MATKKATKTATQVAAKPIVFKSLYGNDIIELKQIQENLGEIRRRLFHLEDDCESLAKVMFNIGIIFNVADKTEDMLSDFLFDVDLEDDDDEIKLKF
jgi:hypothetical protein